MGSGLWKLNVSVLEEPDYFRLISDFWPGWRHRMPAFASLSDWWEMGKSRIKGLTIDYCCRRSQSKSQERDLLAQLASHLKSCLDLGVLSCLEAYKSVLERLTALDREAAKGAQVRSRIRWIEEGESSSAFFFLLEKKRAPDRLISPLRLDNGSVVNSTTGLLEAFSPFYSKLFSAQPCDPHAQSELLSHVLSSLSVDESSSCEGDLSLEECFAALSGMARRKAPGSDGLLMEFYLKFWPVLGQDLVLVLNSCFSDGSLSLSQRRGVISLSFKKGDRLDPKNWRPI